jgi:hypothetical protein
MAGLEVRLGAASWTVGVDRRSCAPDITNVRTKYCEVNLTNGWSVEPFRAPRHSFRGDVVSVGVACRCRRARSVVAPPQAHPVVILSGALRSGAESKDPGLSGRAIL